MKRRTRRILVSIFVLFVLVAGYFYGAQITKIEITPINAAQRSNGLIQKLLSRNAPSLRVLLIIDGKKIYSETKATQGLNTAEILILEFDKPFSSSDVSKLEIHDARFSAAGELIVLGQVLEDFEQPRAKGQGKRFAYRFASRWGF